MYLIVRVSFQKMHYRRELYRYFRNPSEFTAIADGLSTTSGQLD